ncbi:hypothetical protein EDD16DRAFT_1525927 [Pisolithus croceorrhizus]|nr:hypothetical protein EDD16DRAFT_1525927 [Pisolithus croceorrhizus]
MARWVHKVNQGGIVHRLMDDILCHLHLAPSNPSPPMKLATQRYTHVEAGGNSHDCAERMYHTLNIAHGVHLLQSITCATLRSGELGPSMEFTQLNIATIRLQKSADINHPRAANIASHGHGCHLSTRSRVPVSRDCEGRARRLLCVVQNFEISRLSRGRAQMVAYTELATQPPPEEARS